jgi:hypothetical protein
VTEKAATSKRAKTLARLTSHLLDRHGPLISSDQLWEILKFKSRAALDRSIQRKITVLPLFRPRGREGFFVLAPALAEHLVDLSEQAEIEKKESAPLSC